MSEVLIQICKSATLGNHYAALNEQNDKNVPKLSMHVGEILTWSHVTVVIMVLSWENYIHRQFSGAVMCYFTPTVQCKTQIVGFGFKSKKDIQAIHSVCFLKQVKSAIIINANSICLSFVIQKLCLVRLVDMLLSILFLSGKSLFVMEFLCLTNTFLMYLCSCPCSNSLQNIWQASQNSYVQNCLVKEASFLLPCDERRGKRSLCLRGFTIKTLQFYVKT